METIRVSREKRKRAEEEEMHARALLVDTVKEAEIERVKLLMGDRVEKLTVTYRDIPRTAYVSYDFEVVFKDGTVASGSDDYYDGATFIVGDERVATRVRDGERFKHRKKAVREGVNAALPAIRVLLDNKASLRLRAIEERCIGLVG